MRKKMILVTKHRLNYFTRFTDYWEETDHALTGMKITSLDVKAERGLVGTTQGVYVSRDAGQNWALESEGIKTPHVRWVSVHPQDPRFLFIGTEPANIYSKMIDDDQWHQAEEVAELRDQKDWFMPYSPNPGCVRGFAFHDNRIYASVEVGGLLFSDDYGDSWSLVPGSSGKPHQEPEPGQIHPDVHSVETHAVSPDLVLAPTGGGFYMSKDGGATWDKNYGCYCRAVWIDPVVATHMVLGPADGVGRGGRIEHSANGGETWHLIMDNLEDKWPETMVERFVSGDGEIYAVLSNGRILTSRIGEFSWQYLLPGIKDAVMLALV